MKNKIVMLVFIIFIFSSSCFAFKNSYEPESDTSVSFASYSVENNKELTFVNYASTNNTSEYWLRFSIRNSEDKILHYATLTIDGTEYRLIAVDPTAKYEYAASSAIDNSSSFSPFGSFSVARYAFRYYPLSSEIIEKLRTAKTVSLKYHTAKRINQNVKIPDKFLQNINETFSLKYVDFSGLWKPTNNE